MICFPFVYETAANEVVFAAVQMVVTLGVKGGKMVLNIKRMELK